MQRTKQNEQREGKEKGYTRSDLLFMGLAALTVLPLILVVFFGLGAHSSWLVALVTGVAIIAAAFFLSWATEALETVVPQAVALAILALIEIAPEYTIEIILAHRQQITLASASMTGANRLLLGIGWPLIMFIAYVSARRKGESFTQIQLGVRNVPEILCLLLATGYGFVMVIKRSFSLLDSCVLVGIYATYVVLAFRSGRKNTRVQEESSEQGESMKESEQDEDDDADIGVAASTKHLPGLQRGIVIGCFLLVGAFILSTGAERFIDAILQIGRGLQVSDFVLLQWIAPFLSEVPESLTAFIWAGMIVFAAKGLSNMVSAKLNQWTLLIATIPIAYSTGVGHLATVPLTVQVTDELFLTAAQSLFGLVLLLTLRFGLREATALLVLFFAQFFIPLESIRLIIAWVYIALSVLFFTFNWRNIRLFGAVRDLISATPAPSKKRRNEGETRSTR